MKMFEIGVPGASLFLCSQDLLVDALHGKGIFGLRAGALADESGGPAPAGDRPGQRSPVRAVSVVVKGAVALFSPAGGELDVGEMAVKDGVVSEYPAGIALPSPVHCFHSRLQKRLAELVCFLL